MKLLILGGTRFVGRHITEAALAHGHQVTLFNRGKSNTDLFPQVEKLSGDRDTGDLASIKARIDAGATWDAVIDVNGYVPRVVRQSAELLRSLVRSYTFISTMHVYASPIPHHVDENGKLSELEDKTSEEITDETYRGLKVLCERLVEEVYGDRRLVIRPGLVVGPQDVTDRFTYYAARAAKGGEMLAPGNGDDPIQFIDARDLAEFIVRMTEKNASGIYNATGPDYVLTMRKIIETAQKVANNGLKVTWVDEPFLTQNGVNHWTHMPLWIPLNSEDSSIHDGNVNKAIAAGLKFRPLEETMRDIMEWEVSRPLDAPRNPNFGISLEREAELLKAWREVPKGL